MMDEHVDRVVSGKYGGYKELGVEPSSLAFHLDHLLDLYLSMKTTMLNSFSKASMYGAI